MGRPEITERHTMTLYHVTNRWAACVNTGLQPGGPDSNREANYFSVMHPLTPKAHNRWRVIEYSDTVRMEPYHHDKGRFVISVDVHKCRKHGIYFFQASSNAVLCTLHIPSSFFIDVTTINGQNQLWFNETLAADDSNVYLSDSEIPRDRSSGAASSSAPKGAPTRAAPYPTPSTEPPPTPPKALRVT